MKNPEKPYEQTERSPVKDFIAIKKALILEEKNNQQCFALLRQHIHASNYQLFQDQINSLKPQSVLNFLFSEDSMKSTSFQNIFTCNEVLTFLKIINKWSSLNPEILQKQLQDSNNELILHSWQLVYTNLNSKIARLFCSDVFAQKENKEIVQLLGQKNSVFFVLSKYYLTFPLIVQMVEKSSNMIKCLESLYYPLLKETSLSEMSTLASNIESYLLILERESLWTEKQFIKYLTENQTINPALLELKELGFNFWHELAVFNQNDFLKACDLLIEQQLSQASYKHLSELLMQIDHSGETPLDKCLRLWQFAKIQKLFDKYAAISALIFSSSCLNKILINRKLDQKEKDSLIKICLSSQIISKGFVKMNKEKIELIKEKTKKKRLNLSIKKEKNIKKITVNTMKFNFVICYRNIELKTAQDSFGLYPLATYLTHYKDKASLQTIEMLWLNALSKKDIKKLTQLFIREQKSSDLKISRNTNAYKDLELLYNFYQPIWKAMTYMKHGQVLEYLIAKCPINIFQVQLLSKGDTVSVNFFGPHFIRFYILNNPFKGEDQINKAIIESILNCKQKEKSFGQFHLYLQLIRSLADLEDFHSSEEFFVKQVRKTLVAYFNSLSKEDLFTKQEHWKNRLILEWICNPLFCKKIKTSAFLTLEELVQKIGQSKIHQFIENPTDCSNKLQLYENILKHTGRKLSKTSFQYQKFDPSKHISHKMYKTICSCGNQIYSPCSFSSKQYQHGYVMLQPRSTCLQQQITACLKQGSNVYFSQLSQEQPNLKQIKQKNWKELISRMVKEHCSFLDALISEPKIDNKYFKISFKSLLQPQNKLFIQALFDKILKVHGKFTFIKQPTSISNLETISTLIELGNQLLKENKYPFIETISYHFTQNVNKFMRQILLLRTTQTKEENQNLSALSHKKQQLDHYLLKWIPKISKISENKEEKDKIYYQLFLPLMKNCQQREIIQHCSILFKQIDFSLVIKEQIGLAKLSVTENGDTEYLSCLQSLQWKSFYQWLSFFSSYSMKPKLIKCLSKFTSSNLSKLLFLLIQCYTYFKYKFRCIHYENAPDLSIRMILTVFRIIADQNKVKTFLQLNNSASILNQKKNYLTSILLSSHNPSNTTVALIAFDPYNIRSFYFTDKTQNKTKKCSSLNFYSKCSQPVFKDYLDNLQKYYQLCPDLQKHLQIVCNSLIEAGQFDRLNNLYQIQQLTKILTKIIFFNLYQTSNRKIKLAQTPAPKIVTNLFANYQAYNLDWDQKCFEAAYYLDFPQAMTLMKPKQLLLKTLKNCLNTHSSHYKLLVQKIKASLFLKIQNLTIVVEKDIITPFIDIFTSKSPKKFGKFYDQLQQNRSILYQQEIYTQHYIQYQQNDSKRIIKKITIDYQTETIKQYRHPFDEQSNTANPQSYFIGHYIKLNPQQQNLQQKIITCLKNRINVFFSQRYKNQQPNVNNITSQIWKNVIEKMHQDNCSFLQVIFCQPNCILEPFLDIFTSSIRYNTHRKQYDTLFDRMNWNSANIQLKWNLNTLKKFIDLPNKIPKQSSFQLQQLIANLFTSNVYRFLKQIDKLSSTTKDLTSSNPQLNKKIEQLQKYLVQWTPKVLELGKTKEENEQIVKNVLMPFLINCQQTKTLQYCLPLLKLINFYQITHSNIYILKIMMTDHGQEDFLTYLQSCPGKPQEQDSIFQKQMNKLKNKTCKKLFNQMLSKFNAHNLLKFLDILIQHSYCQPYLLLQIYRLTPNQHKIDYLIKRFTVQNNLIRIDQSAKKSFLVVTSPAVTSAVLIFTDLKIKIQQFFYLQDGNFLKKYSDFNFYKKCSKQCFKQYRNSLQKYHSRCRHLKLHLRHVCRSLISAELLDRLNSLFNITGIQNLLAKIALLCLYASSNRKAKIESKEGQELLTNIFIHYKADKPRENEPYFMAAYLLDPQRAIQTMKPKKLTLKAIQLCLESHPETSPLLLQFQVQLQTKSQSQQVKRISDEEQESQEWEYLKNYQWQRSWLRGQYCQTKTFPLRSHYVHNYQKMPWIVDQLRLENKIVTQLQKTYKIDTNRFDRRKRTWRSQEEIFAVRQELYDEQTFWDNVCIDIIRGKKVKDIKIYQKHCPNLKQKMKILLINNGNVKNLQMLQPDILHSLIKQKILSSYNSKEMFTIFLRVVQLANIDLLQLFLTANNLTLTQKYLNSQPQLSFLQHLFAVTNEKFLISFIIKYKLFDQLPLEEWSPILLKTICMQRYNQLLKFTISQIETKFKVNSSFEMATQNNHSKITSKGNFYLPIEEAIAFNFYQFYFLIKSSKNECPLFTTSRRFMTTQQPQQWSYIPELPRRIKINNALMNGLNESCNLDFRRKIILPAVFQLQKNQSVQKSWAPWLNFINSIVTKKIDTKNETITLLQKLTLMTIAIPKTKIPQQQLKKKYPSEMDIIQKLTEYLKDIPVKEDALTIIEIIPQFKPILLQFNPTLFMSSKKLMNQMAQITQQTIETGNTKIDLSQYLKGVQINLAELENNHPTTLQSFIQHYFTFDTSSWPGQAPRFKLERQLLLLLLLDLNLHQRKWKNCFVYQIIHKLKKWNEAEEEFLLYMLALHLNTRIDQVGSFDPFLCNKLLQELSFIQKCQKKLKLPPLSLYLSPIEALIDKYSSILAYFLASIDINCSFDSIKILLKTISQLQKKKNRSEGIFIQISLLMNVCYLKSQLHMLSQYHRYLQYVLQIEKEEQQRILNHEENSLVEILQRSLQPQLSLFSFGRVLPQNGEEDDNAEEQYEDDHSQQQKNDNDKTEEIKITSTEYSFSQQYKNEVQLKSNSELILKMQYQLQTNLQSKVTFCQLSMNELYNNLKRTYLFINLKNNKGKLKTLNQFCKQKCRHPYFKKISFVIDLETFKTVQNTNMIQCMLQNKSRSKNNLTNRIKKQIKKRQSLVENLKNIKLYTPSDVNGPINFQEETDDSKIIDCLSFYELLPLLKTNPVAISFQSHSLDINTRNSKMLQQLNKYFKYFISNSKDEPIQLVFDNQLLVQLQDDKNQMAQVQISYHLFSTFTIFDIVYTSLHFSNNLQEKIEKIFEIRVSLAGLINYYQQMVKIDQNQTIIQTTETLLFNKTLTNLIESILMMISSDVHRLMSLFKGVILKFRPNKQAQQNANVALSENSSVIAVKYEVKSPLLFIYFDLKIKKGLNKDKQTDDPSYLVSKKQFIDSLLTSTELLTHYLLVKNELDNNCLQISTSTSKLLNEKIHFHIEYHNLYKYIGNLKKSNSMNIVEAFLTLLRNYLQQFTQPGIFNYLQSPELTRQYRIRLFEKCEFINTMLQSSEGQKQKQTIILTQDEEDQSGLKELGWNEIEFTPENEQVLKNNFLIQIYKSHYSTLVAEGMSFIGGHETIHKTSTKSTLKLTGKVIKITKPEDIQSINITTFDFLLLACHTLPSADQLHPNKIKNIFITDNNKNLYKLNTRLKNYLLALPPENDERKISVFAPIVPSNLKLVFNLPDQPKTKDNKDIKIFFIDLPKQKEKLFELKIKTYPDPSISTISLLKESPQFKGAAQRLKNKLYEMFQENLKIIIDPSQQAGELSKIEELDLIISLAFSDLTETLNKFLQNSVPNHLIEHSFYINKTTYIDEDILVGLRKKCFLKHYSQITIKCQEDQHKVTFKDNQIVLNISKNNSQLKPLLLAYLTALLEDIIKKEALNLPNTIFINFPPENEGSQSLLKLLDIINILPLQLEQLHTASLLLKAIDSKANTQYDIFIDIKKAKAVYQNKFILKFNLQTAERQLYPAQILLQAYLKAINPQHIPNQHFFSFFEPKTNQIQIFNNQSIAYRLFTILKDSIKTTEKESQLCSCHNFQERHNNPKHHKLELANERQTKSQYFLVDQEFTVTSNYLYKEKQENVVQEQNYQGNVGMSYYFYIKSGLPIDLHQIHIKVTKKNFNKDTYKRLSEEELKSMFTLQLITKNVCQITITFHQSANYVLYFEWQQQPTHRNYFLSNVIIYSEGQMDLKYTQFVQLERFKKQSIIINNPNEQITNNLQFNLKQIFSAPATEIPQLKPQNAQVLQNLTYVVNENNKQYLTRAGEPRIDYIQLCDSNRNPVNYSGTLDVKLVHANRLAIYEPEIIKKGIQIGIKWTPIVRGNYLLYINKTLMNPPYEIGVCAGQADHNFSKIIPPKNTKLCYHEKSQLTLDLRDSYGNIYSQLEQQILGDELLIQLQPSDFKDYLKIDKSPINKYGIKKVNFKFEHSQGDKDTTISIDVLLNRQKILHFEVNLEGYSLEQRKRLLEEAIADDIHKDYEKFININRANFLQDIINCAKQSLFTRLKIRFVNQPGIDAGGVMREFYDLLGCEMKNQKNPFFKMVNKERMEYFLNPDLLKNKNKLDYMEMWGKYLANSILNRQLIGVNLSPVFVKMLYYEPITFKDLLEITEEEEQKTYNYLLTASAEELEDMCLCFTAVVDKKKATEIQLKPGGKEIDVTVDNVKEYLELTADVLLTKRYQDIFKAFRKGFETVLPLFIVRRWIKADEFWCLTAGTKEITAQVILKIIDFSGNNIEKICGWFRRYISEAPRQVLVGFLKFSTGSSSIDFNFRNRITVKFQKEGENPKKLPISHTCFWQIDIPIYKTYEIMEKSLTTAFIYCSEGFGFG